MAQLSAVSSYFLLVALAVSMATGCYHAPHDPNRPPPHPEEFKLPPAEDARFSKPVQYPKNLLNTDILQSRMAKKDSSKGPGMNKGPGSGMGQ
jgi:hypothetical protein